MHKPADLSKDHVIDFCASVVAGADPITVAVTAQWGKPLNECFQVVADHITANGGERVVGWAVWELPGVFIEAELHAVWKSPVGEFLDLVPRGWSFPRITFLPEPGRTYDGRAVDNIRRALVKDNDVKRFLFLRSQHFEIMNRGDRAKQSEVTLTRPEATQINALVKEGTRCEARFRKRYAANFESQ